MGDNYYPEIDEKNLGLLSDLMDQNGPEWLDHPDCPYSDKLKKLLMGSQIKIEDDFDNPENYDMLSSDEHMLKEINSLYKYLQEFGKDMRSSDSAAEKNTYFKISTALLEKLIAMRERTINLSKMNEFTEVVLQIMEDELDVDTRSKILEKLNDTLS
jgi:hypothetical protein